MAVYLADSLFIASRFISLFYLACNSKLAACLAASLAGLAIRQPRQRNYHSGTPALADTVLGNISHKMATFRTKRPPATSLPCWLVSARAPRLSLNTTHDPWLWCVRRKPFVGAFSQSPSPWRRHTRRNWVMSPTWTLTSPLTLKKSLTAIVNRSTRPHGIDPRFQPAHRR